MILVFFFFFSSRRRHTRCSRDWSSDVCSSDLYRHRGGGERLSVASLARHHQFHSAGLGRSVRRSEEHTSELQSRLHLVCRLLLEKKKGESEPCTPNTIRVNGPTAAA